MVGKLPHKMQQIAPVRILRTQPVPQFRREVGAVFFRKHTGILQNSRQKAYQAPGEHLPRRPRSLSENEVADKGGQRAGKKARLRPEGHRRNDNDGGAGLEVGQRDDLKHGAAYHGNGRHHRDRHQLASLGLLLIEYQKEGDGGGQQEEKPQQNIGVEDNVIPEGA